MSTYITKAYDGGDANRPAKQLTANLKSTLGELRKTDLSQAYFREYVERHVSEAIEEWLWEALQISTDPAGRLGSALVTISHKGIITELGVTQQDAFSLNVTMNMEAFKRALVWNGGTNDWVADKLEDAGIVREITITSSGPLLRACYKQAMLETGEISISDLSWLL